MKSAALLLLALLTACAGEPVYQPVEVSVPIAVPCKEALPPQPDWKLKGTPATAPIYDKTKAALIEIDQRKAYEAKLEAALKACR